MMDLALTETLAFLQILVALVTLALMGYTLWRMIEITQEARVARAVQTASLAANTAATARTETSAAIAASHAQETSLAVAAVSENLQKIEATTNGMQSALIAATAKASHLEGRAEGVADTAGVLAAITAVAKDESAT